VLSDPDSGGRASLAGGYEHESNGKDGADTRSIDTLFLQPELRHYLADGVTYVGLIPKLWVYLDKDENRDIPDYRGYGQLGLRFGRDDGLLLAALLRRGSEGHGSTQLDLSYPLRRSVFSGVGAFLHFQYFRGYGETLRDYNESNGTQYRVGFSLVR
jgi:outer membrane phospholipase A